MGNFSKRKEYKVEPEVIVEAEDYKVIRKVLDSVVRGSRFKGIEQIYARVVGDCCRAYGVLGEHNRELYKDILRLKFMFR